VESKRRATSPDCDINHAGSEACVLLQAKIPVPIAPGGSQQSDLPYAPPSLYDEFPMIRANCRARFTAADFDFIVGTLARSQTDHISLVDLLSDVETRDSILDHPRLVDAILNNCGHLRISSQFYFYVLARHVLQQGGIGDRKLCDYVASLLEAFSRANQLQMSDEIDYRAQQYISDMLIALTRATPSKLFCFVHTSVITRFSSAAFSTRTHSGAACAAVRTSNSTSRLAGRTINSLRHTPSLAGAN